MNAVCPVVLYERKSTSVKLRFFQHRTSIQAKKEEIENKELADERFCNQRRTYEDALSKRIDSRQSLSSISTKSMLAQKYVSKTEEHFAKLAGQYEKLMAIGDSMRREIQMNYDELDDLETQLRRVQEKAGTIMEWLLIYILLTKKQAWPSQIQCPYRN